MNRITPPLATEDQLRQAAMVYVEMLREQGLSVGEMQCLLGKGGEVNRQIRRTVLTLIEARAPHNDQTLEDLLTECQEAGMSMWREAMDTSNIVRFGLKGNSLPILLWDIKSLMARQASRKAPWGLSYDLQSNIGRGICSVEQTVAVLLDYWQKNGRMPAPTGMLRCRNVVTNHHVTRFSACASWAQDLFWVSTMYMATKQADVGALIMGKPR